MIARQKSLPHDVGVRAFELEHALWRREEGSHQPHSNLENIVLQRKVREAVPEAAGARLGLLAGLEQVLAGVVDLELRHFGSFKRWI